MSSEVAKTVVESGIVDRHSLEQLRRWGFLLDVEPKPDAPDLTASDLVDRIVEAIESRDAVEIRSTDLDAVRDYLSTRRPARLHVPNPDQPGKTVSIPIEYFITRLGEIVLPWSSDSIADLITNEGTYLKPTGEARIYFADVRELFFGEHRAFMICTPAKGK